MFGKIIFFMFSVYFCSYVTAYRESSSHKLDSGVTTIFVDAPETDRVLVVLCISAGNTDELDNRGVANLLRCMFAKKLHKDTSADSFQYGSESNSYTGHDQSIYYFYGNAENLSGFIRNLGTIFSNFVFSQDDLKDSKMAVRRQITEEQQSDKNSICLEAKKSLYWHSNYGARITGDLDDLESIAPADVENFKNKNYTPNRVTLIVVGNVDKERTLTEIGRVFVTKSESQIERLQEPPHHDSTVRITKHSLQVDVPLVEMYWRVPNYREQRNLAHAVEVFINILKEALQRN